MRNINLSSVVFAIAFLTSMQYACGLKCYVCQSTSPTSSCISNPDTSITCNSKYCTIYRRELAEPEGILTAFYRACEETPTYLNTEVTTPYAKTYYRACDSDLCNTGDGTKDLVSSSSGIITASGDSIVVPGIGAPNDAPSLHAGTVWTFVLFIVVYVMTMYGG